MEIIWFGQFAYSVWKHIFVTGKYEVFEMYHPGCKIENI